MDNIDMLILADISSPIVPDFEILALSMLIVVTHWLCIVTRELHGLPKHTIELTRPCNIVLS